MDSSNILFLALFVLVLLTIIIFYFMSLNEAKSNVRNYLLQRGATDINLYKVWFDDDRDTMTFDVVYTGVEGNRKTTQCKVHRWRKSADREIFWPDPLSLELVHVQKEMPRSEYYEFSEKIRAHLPFELPTYEVSTVLPVPNSEDQIVMMKYVAAFRNIFRCKPNGSMVW